MDRYVTPKREWSRLFDDVLKTLLVDAYPARALVLFDTSDLAAARPWQDFVETIRRIGRERRSERRRWRPAIFLNDAGCDGILRQRSGGGKLEMLRYVIEAKSFRGEPQSSTRPAPAAHNALEASGPWGAPVQLLTQAPATHKADVASQDGADAGTTILANLTAGAVTLVAKLRQRARTVLQLWQLSPARMSAIRRPRKRHRRCCSGPNWGAEVPLARLGALQADGVLGFAAPHPKLVEAVLAV